MSFVLFFFFFWPRRVTQDSERYSPVPSSTFALQENSPQHVRVVPTVHVQQEVHELNHRHVKLEFSRHLDI